MVPRPCVKSSLHIEVLGHVPKRSITRCVAPQSRRHDLVSALRLVSSVMGIKTVLHLNMQGLSYGGRVTGPAVCTSPPLRSLGGSETHSARQSLPGVLT